MRGCRHSGYSLLEALLAIAIVGVALLVSTNALQTHAALARRMEIQQQMLRAAEDVMESLRGEVLPLDGGPVRLDSDRGGRIDGRIRTIVGVEPHEIEGLYEVRVVARSRFLGEAMELELKTMVWRP